MDTNAFTKSNVQRWPYKKITQNLLTYQFLKKIVMEIRLISQQNFDFELHFFY
jgi:hypothetical protein